MLQSDGISAEESKWKLRDQTKAGASNLTPTLKGLAWGVCLSTGVQRAAVSFNTMDVKREQRGQDSNNGLIEKWPSKNLGGIQRIRRSCDDAVFFSEYETKPNCAKSNAAHCIQDGDCGSMDLYPALQSESHNTRTAVCSDLMSSISDQLHLSVKAHVVCHWRRNTHLCSTKLQRMLAVVFWYLAYRVWMRWSENSELGPHLRSP